MKSMKTHLIAVLCLMAAALSGYAQTYTVLKSFNGSDGACPNAGVTLSGTVLYGTTRGGGSNNRGTVFKMNTDGTGYTVLKNFKDSDGYEPKAGVTLSGTVLYGTTEFQGGSNGCGTVFKVNTDGTGFTVLKTLKGADGMCPRAGVTLSGSVLYGTTSYGGRNNLGAIFKVNTDGTSYTVLRSFRGSDGERPLAGLTLSGNVLYGTTEMGGSNECGTVFKMNTDGTGYTVLKHCSSRDGYHPWAGVTLSGSVLYGTTREGVDSGTVFKMNTDGTGFTILKSFNGRDGANPFAGVTLSGSVLYGTTELGGSSEYGTVFKVNTDGTGYTELKSFFIDSVAWRPLAGVTVSGNVLYGTTEMGNDSGGTVFKLNLDGMGAALSSPTTVPSSILPDVVDSESMMDSQLKNIHSELVIASCAKEINDKHVAALKWFDANRVHVGMPASTIDKFLSLALAGKPDQNGYVMYKFPLSPPAGDDTLRDEPRAEYDHYYVCVNPDTCLVTDKGFRRFKW
jgi:uncharacterized repeat protein (TIGR03803 family)